MTTDNETLSMGQGQKRDSLPPAVPVQVQCDGFRCLAYKDEQGSWKDYITGKSLAGEVKVVEYQFG